MSPLLSIAIPTKNRQKYAENAIKSILLFKSLNFELIVEDNSESNTLELFTREISDTRLNYNYNSTTISFSKNFQNALNRCNGEYVIFIGDDDGINPEILNFVKFMKENEIQSVSIDPKVSFFWPGITGLTSETKGVMQINKSSFKVKKYNSNNALYKLGANGGLGYLRLGFPKIYHGIVSRKVIVEVKQKYGDLFNSLSPDIYSAILLSQIIEINYVTNYPFSIPGSSSKSASAASMTKKHVGDLKSAPHFIGNENYLWSQKVPKFYSVETIWAESAVFALEKISKFNTNIIFNQEKLLQECAINHPYFIDKIKKYADENKIKFKKNIKYLISYRKLIRIIKRISFRLLIIFKIQKYIKSTEIVDMIQANEFLAINLEKYDNSLLRKQFHKFIR